MGYFSRLIMILAVSLFLVPRNGHALSADDFMKYLPDNLLEMTATEAASPEEENKNGAVFYRVQRPYSSEKGLLCIIAVVKGAGVAQTADQTLSQGKRIKIKGFDAVQLPPDNNVVGSSARLGNDLLVTVIVLNTEEAKIPVMVLGELDLTGIAETGK